MNQDSDTTRTNYSSEETSKQKVQASLSSSYSNVWRYKPWWCQPWTIVLTGLIIIFSSWLLWHILWLSFLVAMPIMVWWIYFLLLYPRMVKG